MMEYHYIQLSKVQQQDSAFYSEKLLNEKNLHTLGKNCLFPGRLPGSTRAEVL